MNQRSHDSQRALFHRPSGFTLIEVIATLLLSAVLMALLLPLIGSSLKGSRNALLRLSETNTLRTEMDAVWHLYRTDYPNNLPGLSAKITEDAEADPSPYLLLDNDWVDFDAAGAEFIPPPGNESTLRVTLGNSQGERLTTYFFPIP
jgi:prepilin-type N-terminal cleavage/methylation domain-containing protein